MRGHERLITTVSVALLGLLAAISVPLPSCGL